jgi:hypothetical protein
MRKHHVINESYGDYESKGKYDVGIFISVIGIFVAAGFFLYYTTNPGDLSAWIFILIGVGLIYLGIKIMKYSNKRLVKSRKH